MPFRRMRDPVITISSVGPWVDCACNVPCALRAASATAARRNSELPCRLLVAQDRAARGFVLVIGLVLPQTDSVIPQGRPWRIQNRDSQSSTSDDPDCETVVRVSQGALARGQIGETAFLYIELAAIGGGGRVGRAGRQSQPRVLRESPLLVFERAAQHEQLSAGRVNTLAETRARRPALD